LVTNGTLGSSVTLNLEDGNRKYLIVRKITSKGSQTVDVSMEADGKAVGIPATGVKERQAWIEKEVTGATYEMFVNSVMWPQDNQKSFVHLPPSQRKDLLMEMIGEREMDELLESSKAKLSSMESEFGIRSMRMSSLSAEISSMEETLKSLPETPTEGLRSRLSAAKTDLDSRTWAVGESEKTLNGLRERLYEAKNAETLAESMRGEAMRLLSAYPPAEVTGRERSEIGKAMTEIAEAKAELNLTRKVEEENVRQELVRRERDGRIRAIEIQ
ncbi:MAG: hypothetical protein WC291_12700, partial [Thermodesulfovibrionales bacterium]